MVLKADGFEADGWTLNVSRGGVRVILEEPAVVGDEYDVYLGEGAARPVRVVWVRDEPDGQIAGLQFLDVEEGASIPPASS